MACVSPLPLANADKTGITTRVRTIHDTMPPITGTAIAASPRIRRHRQAGHDRSIFGRTPAPAPAITEALRSTRHGRSQYHPWKSETFHDVSVPRGSFRAHAAILYRAFTNATTICRVWCDVKSRRCATCSVASASTVSLTE